MNTTYVVTMGCYSDYQIMGVFSTREKGEEYIQRNCLVKYQASVEEFTLDEAEEYGNIITVWMAKNGEVLKISGEHSPMSMILSPMMTMHYAKNQKCVVQRVLADTEEQAIKIVNESRTRMIALEEWK